MSNIFNIPSCPQIQDNLINYINWNPTFIQEGVTLVPYLLSSENTSGIFQRDLSPRSGKKRVVEVLYQQRILESETGSTHTFACSSEKEYGEQSTTYEFGDQATSKDFKLDPTNYYESCASYEEWFMKALLLNIDVMDRAVETKTWAEIAPLFGKFASTDNDLSASDTIKTVQTKYADETINEDAVAEIDYSKKLLAYGDMKPVLLGEGEIYKYMKKLEVGCCANQGIDMGEFFYRNANLRLLSSYRATTALGENTFYMLRPTAVQMVTWNKFKSGDRNMTIDEVDRKATTIVSPFTGLMYDMVLNLVCDANGGWIWNMSLALTHQLISMPSDLYCEGDNLYGVTGLNKFLISNPE